MDNPVPIQPSLAVRWVVLIGAAAVVLILDQSTKALVTASLAIGETWIPIPALSDFFAITRSANTGAALGILPQGGNLFLLIAAAMSIGIVIFYPRMEGRRWLERIALGILLGGALGNAVDRVRLGYVVDFVHLQLKPLISNVSNIADHAIVVAVVIMLVTQWWEGRTAAQSAHSDIEPATPLETPEIPPENNLTQR